MIGRAVLFSNLYRNSFSKNNPVRNMVKNLKNSKRVSRRDAYAKSLKKPFTLADRKDNVEVLPPPIKSESDKKQYRVIRLENGLTATLISDPSKRPDDSETSSEESEESDAGSTDGSENSTGSNVTEISDAAQGKIFDEEKLAAVALSVGVGSFSDPPDIQGLAHFVEHMVFMGSAKYPTENDFDAFIKTLRKEVQLQKHLQRFLTLPKF